ncbi:PepSY domain-containing protein (plasmid) [Ensifer adhaerens]|uniref:PepSY domain-containing protein n=1 Tax=Ensifer adhaerens TaxID=106592 RepID=UPI001CC06E33|nr:PepSY domain-containing protein [Ensifer adhaerens]MBZ7927307.1 PepSY domain-containing protein [Ensifer adhaerens]UAX98320.1 PepSY domain-containing protein [Ensifer adhaerens]UAY05703.1 PepSY domain-containing protein [Ensifer adhaerens]UAY13081.1 PepSY domain-containing protein [Ensifer adhaerens]
MKMIILATLLLATASGGVARAEEEQNCTSAAKDKWLSENSIKEKAKATGLDVRRVKVEGSCYEVYAIDAKGNKVETVFNPETGAAVGNESE